MGCKNSFAERVRQAIKKLSKENREVSISKIAEQLDLVSDLEKRPLYAALRDLRSAGEIFRINPGQYQWINKKPENLQIREKMWNVFRWNAVVSIPDLQELAGASESYAKEFIKMLLKREILRRLPNEKYQLIKDTVKLPDDEKKAEKLRALRKKKILQALDGIDSAVIKARKVISDLT